MLILTRKLGESINIGEDIKISVLGIHGRQVRIGIEAPLNVIVHREEIYVKIQEENRKASSSITKDLKGMVDLIKNKIKGSSENDLKPPTIDYKDKMKKPNSSQRKPKNR